MAARSEVDKRYCNSTGKVLKIAQKITVYYGEIVKKHLHVKQKIMSIYMLTRGQQEL